MEGLSNDMRELFICLESEIDGAEFLMGKEEQSKLVQNIMEKIRELFEL